MKDIVKMLICVGSCMIVLPIFVVYLSGITTQKNIEETPKIEQVQEKKDIMNEETLVGILAKEIPYTYEKEALKAQAVVTRSYMARRILGIQTNGAVVGYTVEEMKGLWGDDYTQIYNIYQNAVEETKSILIMYDSKPIEALYHEASSGKTRDGKSVYKKEIPYLKSVESSVDKITEQVNVSKEKIVASIKEKYPSLVASASTIENQIQIVSKDEAGYVDVIQVGNITLTGEEVRTMFQLPSCAFKIHSSSDELIFDVKGKGDGIGLSQNGANELAKQGMLYEEIIKYYYTDVTLEEYEVQ